MAAGLTVGNAGFLNTSPTTRLTIENFWEFLSFVVNSIVFLLIGLQLDLFDLESFTVTEILVEVLVAVAAVLLARSTDDLRLFGSHQPCPTPSEN